MRLESRFTTVDKCEKGLVRLGGVRPSGYSAKYCGTERFSLPQPRVAHGFSWQSSPCAVGWHTQVSGLPQRSNSPSELPVPQQANRNQKFPGGVTHSARGLRPGIPRVRSTCQGLPSALAKRVKAQGAPSRKKWGRGGEFGSSQGAMHRKGTEYARRKAFPWLGTEEVGQPIPPQAEKGFLCPAVSHAA